MRIRHAGPTFFAVMVVAVVVGMLPSAASHNQVSVGGSFVMSSTGSGCAVSPECFGRQRACSVAEQTGASELRDGVTTSWRRVPSQLAGKKAIFAYEALRMNDPSWAIVDFFDFLCNPITSLSPSGTRVVTVPTATRWISVTGADIADVHWMLTGPVDDSA